jgi:hypothetical protein
MGLLALCLLPLLYPLVDITSWQRFAAMRTEANAGAVEPRRQSVTLRGLFAMYAVESSLVWLFICLLGGIAVVAIGAPGDADVVQFFVAQISSKGRRVDGVASPMLLIFVLAAALSTMSPLLSASLCTIRYDTLPAAWPELAPEKAQASAEATATRRTLVVGGGLCLAAAAAFCVVDASLEVTFASSTFLALVVASCCAQISVPVIVGAMISRERAAARPVWALIILAAGAAAAVATLVMYLATGAEE